MMPSPIECVTARAQGSILQPAGSRTYLYFCPARAPGTSADQDPSPWDDRGEADVLQPLNSPATWTAEANGAHTRKVTPPS
jgi:hypothetical protein